MIKTGTLTNARDPEKKGWFIGHFMDEPFTTSGFGAKWASHPKGDRRSQPSANDAKTVCILIHGRFVVRFPDEKTESMLSEQGAYVWWDAKVSHDYEALEDSVVLTIRWSSEQRSP